MTDQKLSPHFALSELLNSPTATLKGYVEQFDPTPQVVTNLKNLCTFIAEPVRDYYELVKGSDIHFDELIVEHDSAGHYWLHLSYASDGVQRGICLIGTLQPGGGTTTVNDGFGAFKSQA